MKTLTKVILLTLASAGLSQAAVTITCKNFSTPGTVGIPVLDLAGNAETAGNRSWSIGYFTTGFDFSTATATTLQSNFTIFGATSTTFAFNGGFNASISATLPGFDSTYTGKTIYTMVGNGATIATSTAFAVLTANVLFPSVDVNGAGAATSTTAAASNVVFGKLMAPVTQPPGGSYPQGVQVLVAAVPEPSAALLGAFGVLGLLRRRRI